MHSLRTLHLFAGAGGGILADILLGHTPVCAVEIDTYCQQVLSARQADGCLPWFPIFPDVTQFDGTPWRGLVDIVAGGFPCQDISIAGKGAGITGGRSGLWRSMARIIREVVPGYVFVENSPVLTSRGLGTVLGDLASMGYDAKWGVLGAFHLGAPHPRERLWMAAYPLSERWRGRMPFAGKRQEWERLQSENLVGKSGAWEEAPESKARVLGMDDGVADGVDRRRCIGNGQVPVVAATAFRILSE